MSNEIVIADVADSSYVVQKADLIPAVKGSDGLPVSLLPGQLGTFIPYSRVTLVADGDVFDFTIPSDAKLVKFDGLIGAESTPGVVTSGLQVNGLATAIYDWTTHHFGGNIGGDSGDMGIASTSIEYSSSWSNNEHVILEATLEVNSLAINRHAFKGSTHNTGGAGDFHISGGFIELAAAISSVKFLPVDISTIGYAAGSFITMSVLR